MNIQALMKQAQKMQKDLQKKEEEFNQKEFTTTLGGGAVEIQMKGDLSIQSIKIDEDLLEADNKEMIEDMFVSGLNELIQKISKEKDKSIGNVTNGMKMPGLF